MIKNIISTIILSFIALTALNAQENKNKDRQNIQNRQYNSDEERKQIVTNFRNTYLRARDRIDRLQENAPLRREVTYEKEEELLRKAQQILGLLDDGHYIKRSELNEWERKLNNLGNQDQKGEAQSNNANRNSRSASPENRRNNAQENDPNNVSLWNQRVIRADNIVSTSADRIKSSRQKIVLTKKRLDEQLRDKKITEAEYNKRMERVKQAEGKINDLEERLNQEKQRISELKKELERIPD